MRRIKALITVVCALLVILLYAGVKLSFSSSRVLVTVKPQETVTKKRYNPAVDLTVIRKTTYGKVGQGR